MKKRYTKPMSERRLAAVKDKDIDFSDTPELDESYFASARVVTPSKSAAPKTAKQRGSSR